MGTFAGHYLSVLASLATIQAIKEENLVENARKREEQMSEGLKEMVQEFDFVYDARGLGCVQGLEVDVEVAEKLVLSLFRRGLLAITVGRHHNVLKLTPPITVTEEQVEEALSIIRASLSELK